MIRPRIPDTVEDRIVSTKNTDKTVMVQRGALQPLAEKSRSESAPFLLFFSREDAKVSYRLTAQSPVMAGSHAVGVLTQNIASSFYGEILRGIEHGFRGTVLHPLFTSAASSAEARHAIERRTRHRVDALRASGGQVADAARRAAGVARAL